MLDEVALVRIVVAAGRFDITYRLLLERFPPCPIPHAMRESLRLTPWCCPCTSTRCSSSRSAPSCAVSSTGSVFDDEGCAPRPLFPEGGRLSDRCLERWHARRARSCPAFAQLGEHGLARFEVRSVFQRKAARRRLPNAANRSEQDLFARCAECPQLTHRARCRRCSGAGGLTRLYGLTRSWSTRSWWPRSRCGRTCH